MDLEELRQKIDEIDHKILELLAERLKLSPKIAALKREQGLSIEPPDREEELYHERQQYLASLGITDEEIIRQLFSTIMKKSKELQK